MMKNLRKKGLFLLAVLGLVGVQTNAQTHDQTFSDNASFQLYNNGYGSGARSHEAAGVNSDYDGVTHDGALKLERDGNNNANFGFNGGIDAETYKYIKIVYKNETVSTVFRVQGKNTDGGDPAVITSIVGYNTDITTGTGNWETAYVNLTGVATWANTIHDLDLLIKSTTAVPASGDTGHFYLDEITFLTELPGIAKNFADFVGAEGADDESPGTIDPASDGHEEVTGWHFGNNANLSFSDDEAYEGNYSVKITAAAATNAGWFYYARQASGSHPVAADKTLLDAGTQLVVLNVFVESGAASKVRINITNAAPAANISNIDFNISGLEAGKWHRLVKEISPTDVVTDLQFGLQLVNTANSVPVVYIDGIEFLSQTASEYVATTGVNNSWGEDATWSGIQPVATDIVYIKDDVNIWHAGEVAKEVFVNDGKSITFKNSVPSLTSEKLHLGVSGALTIEAGSSLIVTDKVTGNGNITYKRTLTANALPAKAWHSVSSPVSGQTVASFMANHTLATGSAVGTNRGIATYNNATPGFSYYQDGYADADSFDDKAYIVKLDAAGDISFTGGYNSGDVDFSISQGAGDHYNLVGNPTTAYINVGTFFSDNNAADRLSESTLYIWDDGNDKYEPKLSGDNAGFNIAPGQAFFVKAGSASNNKVTFTSANQSHETSDSFLKSDSKTEIYLNVTQGDFKNKTKVSFIDGASKGFDNGYDGSVFSAHNYQLDVFTQIIENNKEKNLVVQSLPRTDLESSIISLGLIAGANEEISFTSEILNLPTEVYVYLEDRQEGVFTKLNEANTSYKVILNESINGAGRFFIHTTAKAILSTDDISLQGVSIFKSNNSTLKIAGLKNGNASVSIFNLLGKNVLKSTFQANGVKEISLPKLATGVYLVQLTTESGKLNKKIILE
jgi:hypothetical protein